MAVVWFVVAAAVGTVARWRLAEGPWSTAAVNLVGSAGLGVAVDRGHSPAVTVALLGSLTTFSAMIAFAETNDVTTAPRRPTASLAIAVTVILGPSLAWAGLQISA